ncbi:hypothetical protein D3C85_1829510 [compost metagenome]
MEERLQEAAPGRQRLAGRSAEITDHAGHGQQRAEHQLAEADLAVRAPLLIDHLIATGFGDDDVLRNDIEKFAR